MAFKDMYTSYTLTCQDIIAIILYTFAFYIIVFSICRLHIFDTKKLSCVITFGNSLLMSIIGLTHIAISVAIGLNIFSPSVEHEHLVIALFSGRSNVSCAVCAIYAATSAIDLIIGLIYYPERVNFMTSYFYRLLTAWILYFAVTGNGLLFRPSVFFANALMWVLIEEVPTCVAACGIISPSLRSDIGFGLAFFMTRVLLHAHLLVQVASKFPNATIPPIVKLFYFVSLLVNMYMFYGWCAQLGRIKRRKVKKRN